MQIENAKHYINNIFEIATPSRRCLGKIMLKLLAPLIKNVNETKKDKTPRKVKKKTKKRYKRQMPKIGNFRSHMAMSFFFFRRVGVG